MLAFLVTMLSITVLVVAPLFLVGLAEMFSQERDAATGEP